MPNSVLIVDDEEGIRRSLAGVLEDEGMSVETAPSGEECLALFERRLFSCVLLDVWLPGIDGIETLERTFPTLGRSGARRCRRRSRPTGPRS